MPVPFPIRAAAAMAALLLSVLLCPSPAAAARVLIVGDLQYALVAEVAADIRASVREQVREYPLAEVRGRLGAIVEREEADVVVALGTDALNEALRLPSSVTVVYGLVAAPPKSVRERITGVYMSPPATEYLSAVRRWLPAIRRVAVVGSPPMIRALAGGDLPKASTYPVGGSTGLVETVNRLSETDALLLLPDVTLLTASAMESVFAFSYRKNVPLLGISEGHVKQGALFALVFDPRGMSLQIGDAVRRILDGAAPGEIPASAPRKFNLFVNANTARKMGISVPDEMLAAAKRVYR
jgi:ABC-type uncharacterized transport system substrate-binding protein